MILDKECIIQRDDMENNRYKASAKKKKREEKANKHINFVVIVYVILMAYLLFIVYHSLTKDAIHYVYAESGEILNEGSFKGVFLRNEDIVYSNDSGPVKYFVPEGDKIRLNTYVCVINQDSEMERILNEQVNEHLNQLNRAATYTIDDYSILKDRIRSYVVEKKRNDLGYASIARDNIETTLFDISQTVMITDQDLFDQIQKKIQSNQDKQLQNGTYYKMEKSGVISYTIDGFEEVTIDTFDSNLFARDITSVDITKKQSISDGDPLYKIVDNYLFYLVSEIDPYCEKHLEDRSYVSIFFPTKNISVDVKVHRTYRDGDKIFAVYELDRYFNLFFSDRKIDYKIIYNQFDGLKIPNEAITTKDVYKVPKSAIQYNKGSYQIQKSVYSKDDTSQQELIPIDIKEYFVDGDFSYVRSIDQESTLNTHDKILYVLDPNATVSDTETYSLEAPNTIEGVYVVNKGYTDFRRIETVYEDKDFRIIESQLRYSIGLYDKIVADSSGIEEFTTLK